MRRMAAVAAVLLTLARGAAVRADCEPPGDDELCEIARASCGEVETKDRCGTPRKVTCGSCRSPQICGVVDDRRLCHVPRSPVAFHGPTRCEPGAWCLRRPTVPALAGGFGAVWASSPTEVWLAPAEAGQSVQHLSEGAWRAEPLPASTTINAFWGCRPSSLWAAGDGGALFHWNGRKWARQRSGTRLPLRSLWGSGCKDVWASGARAIEGTPCDAEDEGEAEGCASARVFETVLLHSDGARWTQQKAPAELGGRLQCENAALSGGEAVTYVLTGDGLVQISKANEPGGADRWGYLGGAPPEGLRIEDGTVWANGPMDVWAGGGATLWLYNGGAWVNQRRSSRGREGLPGDFAQRSMWGSRDGQLWVVGQRDDSSAVFEHSHGEWFGVEVPDVGPLRAMHAAAADLVWVAGERGVLRLERGSWRKTTDSVAVSFEVGPGDVWIAIDDELFRWNGRRWLAVPGLPARVRSLWGTGDRDMWAAIEQHPRVHYSGADWDDASRSDLHHWDGTRWQPVRDELAAHLRATAVWGRSRDDIWAVGLNPQTLPTDVHDIDSFLGAEAARRAAGSDSIAHFDGKTWRTLRSPSTEHWLAVWGPSANDVWIVGSKGGILHWDGRALAAATSPATKPLWAVRGRSATDVWAVGDDTLVHWDGKAWTAAKAPVRGVWQGLCGNDRELWAVGGHPAKGPRSESTLLRWDGQEWIDVPTLADKPALSSCLVSTAGELWIGGADGLVAVRR